MILEIVAGVLGFVFRSSIVDTTAERSLDSIQQYREPEDDEFRSDVNTVLDFLQDRVSMFVCECTGE